MKCLFFSSLDVTQLASGSWCLLRDLRANLEDGSPVGRSFCVPAGFETDFASVPRLPFAYWVFGGTVFKSAVLHDALYSGLCDNAGRGVTRAEADAIFHAAMATDGVPWWRRQLMFSAVRLFGGDHYGAKHDLP